jgi:polysaccharide export outer membrane protein
VNERVMRKAVWGNVVRLRRGFATVVMLGWVVAFGAMAGAQAPTAPAPAPAAAAPAAVPATPANLPASAALPDGYVIGPDDVLTVVFWRDKEMSAEVVVRPDGRISLPLINDVEAAGLSPDQLRVQLEQAASKYIAEPNAAVVVKTINSRKVYITGNVLKPGTYPLNGEMTVLQLIAVAGGLQEYADSKKIVVMRKEEGKDRHFPFNYKDVIKQKNLQQNVSLKPGDTVVVP